MRPDSPARFCTGLGDHRTEFHNQSTAGPQSLGNLSKDSFDHLRPLGSGNKRLDRFILTHGGGKLLVLRLAHVRRIAADQIKLLRLIAPNSNRSLSKKSDLLGRRRVARHSSWQSSTQPALRSTAVISASGQVLGECDRDRSTASSDVGDLQGHVPRPSSPRHSRVPPRPGVLFPVVE